MIKIDSGNSCITEKTTFKIKKQIPFFVIIGFLGSGKTTFLKEFLKHYGNDKKIAIIQNEFSSINVDASELLLLEKEYKIVQINNGSVFCVCLLSNFNNTLLDLLNNDSYDAIVLEATGLADPLALGQIMEDRKLVPYLYLAHAWTIVDALIFLKMQTVVSRIGHQIRIADTVLLNKIDLVDEKVKDECIKISGKSIHLRKSLLHNTRIMIFLRALIFLENLMRNLLSVNMNSVRVRDGLIFKLYPSGPINKFHWQTFNHSWKNIKIQPIALRDI